TSALPEEGKSATAINLAVVLAQSGRRVMIVDTDLRRPRLHRVFGVDNSRGVSTFLSGLEREPDPLVIPTGIENLEVFPRGPIPPNPSELLDGPLLAELGERYAQRGYDHLILDSPPLLALADPVIVASRVEATLVVARAGRTPKETLREAAMKLSKAGVRPI